MLVSRVTALVHIKYALVFVFQERRVLVRENVSSAFQQKKNVVRLWGECHWWGSGEMEIQFSLALYFSITVVDISISFMSLLSLQAIIS